MRLERRWWRLKKDIRNWIGDWIVRLGVINPFGKCPNCRSRLRYTADQQPVKNLDGTTTINVRHGVACPKCGFVSMKDN